MRMDMVLILTVWLYSQDITTHPEVFKKNSGFHKENEHKVIQLEGSVPLLIIKFKSQKYSYIKKG